jgi:hypothetical protein
MHLIHSSFSSSVEADIRYTECFPVKKQSVNSTCLKSTKVPFHGKIVDWISNFPGSLNYLPSTTLPSESVLQALITSLLAEKSSKQWGLDRSVTSRIRIFSKGIIPRGSLSVVNSK